MKTHFFLLILILPFQLINAQTNGEKAKAYYFEAQNQYNSGNYTEALNYLQKTEEALGSTNARILNLKVKVLYDAKRYNGAKSAITQFGEYDNNAGEDLKRETYSYLIKIEEIEEKEKEKKIVEEKRRIEERNKFIAEEKRKAEEEEKRKALAIVKIEKNKQLSEKGLADYRDGKHYKLVAIGEQLWMAENLAYKTYTGCWAYNKDIDNITKYGYLYNWETAKTACPTGWRLPSKADLNTLLNNYGGDSNKELNYNALIPGGASGFSVSFGGWLFQSGNFSNIGVYAGFWSLSAGSHTNAWGMSVIEISEEASVNLYDKSFGLSIRCIKDQ